MRRISNCERLGRFILDGVAHKCSSCPCGSPLQKRKSRAMRGFLVWWAHTDLNRGPKDYESSALTN